MLDLKRGPQKIFPTNQISLKSHVTIKWCNITILDDSQALRQEGHSGCKEKKRGVLNGYRNYYTTSWQASVACRWRDITQLRHHLAARAASLVA